MKVGLISAEKHCKPHIRRMREAGYDVVFLGDSPSTVPEVVDVLVVRVASCSHNGTGTANDWRRSTGKPCIFQDGVTGILLALEKLTKAQEEHTVRSFTTFNDVTDLHPKYSKFSAAALERAKELVLGWLSTATPDDIKEARQAFLATNRDYFIALDKKMKGKLISSQINFVAFVGMVIATEEAMIKTAIIKRVYQEVARSQLNVQSINVVAYWLGYPLPPSFYDGLKAFNEQAAGIAPEPEPATVVEPPADLIEETLVHETEPPPVANDLRKLIDDNATQILECMEMISSLQAEVARLRTALQTVNQKIPAPAPAPQPAPEPDVVTAKKTLLGYLRELGVQGPITIRLE